MVDDVFALSPISARAALPSEQDYDAIREAFMETSRGRWFLGEYARRNRNADTTMVLDAVVRIEQAMAAQRQESARNDDELRAVLAAIRHAVDEAAEKASTALIGLELSDKLSPIHKGTRIIKEISWRWREIGADGRICDMIDSQLAAIEASCTAISETDGSAALREAFDLLRNKLDTLARDNEAAAEVNGSTTPQADVTAAAESAVAPAPAPMTERADRREAQAPGIGDAAGETAFAAPEQPGSITVAEPEIVTPEPESLDAAAVIEAEPAAMGVQAADADSLARAELAGDPADALAEDEAVLEMVAIEMAAPDDSFDDFLPEEIAENHMTLPPVVAPVATSAPEPAPAPRLEVAPPPPQRVAVVPPPPQFLAERAPSVAPEPSLGSSLLASGILQRPKAPSDPMAPIRRMTQAEKIAFFS